MKKMFYAVAVIAAMAVCSCGNKAENADATEIVDEESVELVAPATDKCNSCDSCNTPCDSCKAACDSCKAACDSCKAAAKA